MHLIQSHILKELTHREKGKYAELKPAHVESNRFVYHLKRLLDDGLIAKNASFYFLTAPGKRFISKLSLKSFSPRVQPKIVSVLIVQNREKKYLLMNSKRQPFIGKISFPYGKIHYGETLTEAASRELREKTGLSAALMHCGDAYLSVREKGEIVSHMLCHVFYGKNPTGSLIETTKTHSNLWERLDHFPRDAFVPGFVDLNMLRLKKSPFFAELAV